MARTSFRTNKPHTTAIVKFLCSYGGKILPRYPDGKLRYYGGETRVLAVERSISFSELSVKVEELCGTPVALRCQLPSEDLDALVSITSDEDLVNLVEEYERTLQPSSPNFKIRAFLLLPKNPSPISPPPPFASCSPPRFRTNHCIQQMLKEPKKLQFCHKKSAGNLLRYACVNSSQSYLVHNGNHWQ